MCNASVAVSRVNCTHAEATHARLCVGVWLQYFVDMDAVCLMLILMCCDVLRVATHVTAINYSLARRLHLTFRDALQLTHLLNHFSNPCHVAHGLACMAAASESGIALAGDTTVEQPVVSACVKLFQLCISFCSLGREVRHIVAYTAVTMTTHCCVAIHCTA